MKSPGMTGYRHISQVSTVAGGRPVIRGTRVPVKAIIGYYKLGLSVEEILEGLPQLFPAQVYEALSYYHDHTAEIERDIEESRVERLVERYGLKVMPDGRLVADGNDDF